MGELTDLGVVDAIQRLARRDISARELTEALIDAGFANDDVAKVMGGNVRRLLADVLPAV